MTKMTKLLTSDSRLRWLTATGDKRASRRGLLSVPIAAGLCCVLAGCSAMTAITPTAEFQSLEGSVHGGQQAVSGATISLIAPGTTGYGSAGTVLASATTTSHGNFTLTLPQPASCPANSGLVYIMATGGNPGAGTNNALAEAAVLGPCSGLTSLSFISINEVTTVAAAYTLAPFASLSPGTTNIGTSSTNLLGLTNAAAAAGNLANLATGQAGTSTTGITLPTNEVNTLADILSACINTNVSGVPSTTCSSLFTAATPPSGTAPTDTFQAAIDIALNPGNNSAALFALSTPSPPYQPTLSANPGDFALGIQYSSGNLGLAQPQGIDIDAQGNAWVSTYGCGRQCPGGLNGLMEVSPSGVVSPSSGVYLSTLGYPQSVAVNSGGMVEVVDFNNGVQEYAPPGATGSGFASNPVAITGGSTAGPAGIAIDNRDGSTWVANYNSTSIVHFSQTGTFLTASSPLTVGNAPWGIALNASADVIVADSDSQSGQTGNTSAWTEAVPTGTGGTYNVTTASTGSGLYPSDVAIDHAGNIWLTVNSGTLVYSSSGALVSPTTAGYATNSNNFSGSIKIDGLGRAFVAENTASGTQPGPIAVFANNGTLISTANSSYGYYANNTIPVDPFTPQGIALDASGNCWIAGNTPSVVTELIGIAAPVATPIATQNTPTNRLGVRP